jgi:hypothetical protein
LEEEDETPVEPWSVQEPTSIVEDVATPMAEFWLPNVETA